MVNHICWVVCSVAALCLGLIDTAQGNDTGVWTLTDTELYVEDVTSSSIALKWRTIQFDDDQLDDVKKYYNYVVEYKLDELWSFWIESDTLSHSPDQDGYQTAVIYGLTKDKGYVVRVRSIRVLGGKLEYTSATQKKYVQTLSLGELNN